MKKKFAISFNSPVILSFTLISLIILISNTALGGTVNRMLAVRYTSWADPMMYLRMITHVMVHQDFSHLSGNFLLILVVGPLIEEKYGSLPLTIMIIITAIITGLINIIFFRNIMLLGASGVVFMLILLSSFANVQKGKFPITVLLVGLIYIGNEVAAGVLTTNNISQLSHILGGLCGAVFGFFFHGETIKRPKW